MILVKLKRFLGSHFSNKIPKFFIKFLPILVAVKLDSSNNPTSTYGYLSAVTASTVTVTWATGVISASDTIRYYIPLKAGDSIHVRNDQFKFTGSMLVNKIEYQETTGVTQTVLTVTGVDNTATNNHSAARSSV